LPDQDEEFTNENPSNIQTGGDEKLIEPEKNNQDKDESSWYNPFSWKY
jgi:hypothetical protein